MLPYLKPCAGLLALLPPRPCATAAVVIVIMAAGFAFGACLGRRGPPPPGTNPAARRRGPPPPIMDPVAAQLAILTEIAGLRKQMRALRPGGEAIYHTAPGDAKIHVAANCCVLVGHGAETEELPLDGSVAAALYRAGAMCAWCALNAGRSRQRSFGGL